MALNNLGAAHLEAGDWDLAESTLQEALSVDPEYPIPYFNLALLAEFRKDRAESERLLTESAKRGYRSTTFDEFLIRVGSLLARIEGRGGAKAAGEGESSA